MLIHGETSNGSTRHCNYLEVYWPCAGGPSAVNVIGTRLRDPLESGLIRWRLTVYMDAVAESGRNPAGKLQIPPECGK